MRPILLIDGLNLFLRNYAVNPSMNTNGDHCGGVLGTLRSLKCLVRDNKPSLVIIVWDGAGGSSKRRGIYAEYKAGRKPRVNRQYDFGESSQSAEQNLKTQFLSIKRYVELLGIQQVEIENIEADDVIGYLCRHTYPDREKIIVSTDKDFLQLVDATTLVYSPIKAVFYGSDRVTEDFHCLPENFVFLKAIMGDGSDNIKGLKGFGIKTVHKLLPFMAERETTLDEILEHSEQRRSENKRYGQIADSRDILTANVQLMQLTTPVISSPSVRAIRYSLETLPGFTSSELKLSLMRDGVQLTDSDFFTIFKEYSIMSRKEDSER